MKKTILIIFLSHFLLYGCQKIIEINPPSNSITTPEVFANASQAKSAMAGVYYNMVNDPNWFSGSQITYLSGLSSDELELFNLNDQVVTPFYKNELLSSNSYINTLWKSAYSSIYSCNSIIEELSKTNTIIDSIKKELIAEAKFVRGFCYFNLLNLFGPVPLVKTTNWRNTNLLGRSTKEDVYNFIIEDLLFARDQLSSDYSFSNQERIVPNKWAASALLAKVFLYTNKWREAEIESTNVIQTSGLYQLVDLNNICIPNNGEAIWQLKQQPLQTNLFASPIGVTFIPVSVNSNIAPKYIITQGLINSFSVQDGRRMAWIGNTIYTPNGSLYRFPYKYKTGRGQTNGQYTEYHTVLRLGEQYLICAEAKYNQGNISGSIQDLNKIRGRAGLTLLPLNLSQTQAFDSLVNERKLELFGEWGNRWFDLKRWSKATEILSPIKGVTWQRTDELYPIPISETQINPNIKQNDGYN